MQSFLIALQFLTIIPVQLKEAVSEDDLTKSMPYFPLVGLLLGVILVLVNLISSSLFPPLVAKAIVLITLVILTGALPLEEFATACEGFFSGKRGDEALTIMRERHLGFRGVVGLILLLLIKFALLCSLMEGVEFGALLLMPLVGRWALVVIRTFTPYARGVNKESFSPSGKDDYRGLVRASLITFIISLLLFGFFAIPLMAAICLSILILRWFILRKLGGITGDCPLRATVELIEIVALLLINLI